MKKFLLFLCLIAATSVSFAQTQRGYVKTRGRLAADGTLNPGMRLPGVILKLKDGSCVVSGNDGQFCFLVQDKVFCIASVEKEGYQLYNSELLGRSCQYSNSDLIIVMDTPDNVLADRCATEIKMRRMQQRQLAEKENEIEALKDQERITEEQYKQQLKALYESQENNEKLISEMAERYSTIDFDLLDDFQRCGATFIQNGEFTRADSLFKTRHSIEEVKNLTGRLQKEQEDLAADCFIRAEIFKTQCKNDSAAYWLGVRANLDTLNVAWQLDAGDFIVCELADYNAALRYYNRALTGAIIQGGEQGEKVEMIYGKIGQVYYSAKAQGVELPGFKEFTQSGTFICTTGDSPASKSGMSGEYYVLEFADWTIDSNASLYAKDDELRGRPKTIVVQKEDEISRFHLENTIGLDIGFKKVGEEEKQRILKAYREWKEKQ